jgi:hypothetical protein
MAREIAMFKWCSHHYQKRSAPLCRNWEMFKVARSGAELGNNEWLEKLQCSSGVPIIVKSVVLRSIGTGKCSSAVPMIVARSGAERGNNEWLEKLKCSSVVPIIVKSVPLLSVGTGKCSRWHGGERSGEIMNG